MLGATVTANGPEVAAAGIVMLMEVALQELTVVAAPFNSTVLPPCKSPKPEPEISTCVPVGPLAGEMDVIVAAGAEGELRETLSKVPVASVEVSSLVKAKPM